MNLKDQEKLTKLYKREREIKEDIRDGEISGYVARLALEDVMKAIGEILENEALGL
jgi:hypothetical protein